MKRMKKVLLFLLPAIVGVGLTAWAGTRHTRNVPEVVDCVTPGDITIRHTIAMEGDDAIDIYYKITGNRCLVYCPEGAIKYVHDDFSRFSTCGYEVVESPRGYCVKSMSINQVARFVKKVIRHE